MYVCGLTEGQDAIRGEKSVLCGLTEGQDAICGVNNCESPYFDV